MNGGSMFFLIVYIHLFRGLYYGSYKYPRELLWILGVVILVLMIATAFMGYVLPWGQMSYWAATVITNLFSAIPVVGDKIVTLLWGGFTVGNPTLNRFYSLHYLLPFVIIAVVGLHLLALHQHGSNNPLGIDHRGPQDTIPFHPYYTIKDMFGLSVFLIFFSIFIFYIPNMLSSADNYIPANPMVTPNHIVPEWYLLPYYAILRSVPNKLFGVILSFGSILLLFLVPWLDTSRVRSARFRPIYRIVYWLLPIDVIALGWVGANPPTGAVVTVGQIATFYYFFHFLVLLPLIGKIETPRPLPISIGAAVLTERR
jgi:ubiquinol-cytochrome c reductase cytochrome b subunit